MTPPHQNTTKAREPVPIAALVTTQYARAMEPRPIDLMLDANEGLAPDTEFLASLLPSTQMVGVYPSAAALEALLAQEHGVDASRVVVTAGADDAIERICRVATGPGRTAVITDPTFEMIPRFVQLACGVSVRVPWMEGTFPTKAVCAATDESTGLICIVTPNNPTGLVATREDIKRVRAACPHAVVLVDCAYGEFADDDLTEFAVGLEWTVVTRTFSKAWGLAGLRVGYAICDARVAPWLRRSGLPYAAAGYSIAAATAWRLAGREKMNAYVARVRRARGELHQGFVEAGAAPTPSQANFVLARCGDARLAADLLAGMGIGVRRYTQSHDIQLQSSIRVGVPTGEGLTRLLGALRTITRPDALLFDMDGVLVDVSGSYRRAIVQTCAAFGVTVTNEDIAAATAAGNANNDWVVTQRLLAARGVELPLEQVKITFEELYQGGQGKGPGLKATETPLLTTDQVTALAARFRLGVVTGRPRRDAAYFLESQGWGNLFGAMVCMEDGPLKPSPAPVELCLHRLGLARHGGAWMLGDTPDDIRAAREAGVLPIGVVPPGENVSLRTAMLLGAGAGRVLERTADLSQLSSVWENGL